MNKLQHDLNRLTAAQKQDRREAIYAAYDCAVTAWSLIDWTFNNLSAEKLNRLGAPDSSKESFIKNIKHEIPHLDFCYQLATGAKHFFVTQRPDLAFDSEVSELGRVETDIETGERRYSQKEYYPRVTSGNRHLFIDDLFSEMVVKWQAFLRVEDLDKLVTPEQLLTKPGLYTHQRQP